MRCIDQLTSATHQALYGQSFDRSLPMNLHVESTAGPHGDPEPIAFMLGESRLDIVRIVDRWFGEDYCYFKTLASDDATYILRFDVPTQLWNLTLYQVAPASRKPA